MAISGVMLRLPGAARRAPRSAWTASSGAGYEELTLDSHPDLYVGNCVPFYFCPRSVMLYVLHMGNLPDLGYRGGQEPIVHLEADLLGTVDWANCNQRRWACYNVERRVILLRRLFQPRGLGQDRMGCGVRSQLERLQRPQTGRILG